MVNEQQFAREAAVPWDADTLVAFYEHSHPLFSYREEVLKMALDAHKLYVLGFPKPSIIMSGEALLRAIYDRIVVLVTTRGRISYQNINGRPLVIQARDIGEARYEWNNQLTFHDAILILKRSRVYPRTLTERMFVIKELRNIATHGELPLLDDFDPDDPRSKEDFIKLLSGDVEKPEGYQFMPFKSRRQWFKFACRDHGIGTLKSLPVEDRYAAIQYVLATEALAGMLSFPSHHS